MVNSKDRIDEFLSLYKGVWDKGLPAIFPFPDDAHIDVVLNSLDTKRDYELFCFANTSLINYVSELADFRASADVGKGSEPAFYYSYKNSQSLRQMGILNPLTYVAFVYNLLALRATFLFYVILISRIMSILFLQFLPTQTSI